MSKKRTIREILANDYDGCNLLVLDPASTFDKAIIGVTAGGSNAHVLYDYDKVIAANMEEGMTESEAMEHFDYNQASSYHGSNAPMFMTLIDKSNVKEEPKPKRKTRKKIKSKK